MIDDAVNTTVRLFALSETSQAINGSCRINSSMRPITGDILLPANTPTRTAAFVLIEVRDVSVADAPSVVVAEQRLRAVLLKPDGNVSFQVQVPEVDESRSLALRVHISLDGSEQPKSGDLLSTSRYVVPGRARPAPMKVQVEVI